MMTAILFVLLFAISGIGVSEVVFAKHKLSVRIWLGLALGLLMLTWLPSLFAFFIGFTLLSQILSAVVAFLLLAGSVTVLFLQRKRGVARSYRIGRDWTVLLLAVPIFVLFCFLLNTHVLNRHEDGSLWVGQVTYGDLAMHLGFITSIAEQTTFPPQYSIFPGHALNYPFLCETSGASLYLLGASVRAAYNLSAGYAFLLVVFGVYRFFEQWLKRRSRAMLATVLFFFGGGFGFFYFFDLAKSGGILTDLLGTRGQTVSQTLLDGFYLTPTNIPALGLRWVNPIVDMLIPQRATLFGWAFLFPCLYLLHGYAFEGKRHNVIPLAVIAGLLPMIHTHSFLALGIVSAVYCITDLITVRFEKRRLIGWLLYACITVVIAAPQLFLFTFRQASESSLVRFHLNWGNETDSYLWFYIKNLGLIFLLTPFAFLVLPKRDKKIFAAAIAIWIIAELVEFQPNDYDNNKLLFVSYVFCCGLVSKFLLVLAKRIRFSIARKTTAAERCRTHLVCIGILLCAFTGYYLFKLLFDSQDGFLMRPGTALTLFFGAGLLLALCIGAFIEGRRSRTNAMITSPALLTALWMIGSLLFIWLRQYRNTEYRCGGLYVGFTSILCIGSLFAFVLVTVLKPQNAFRIKRFAGGSAAITVAAYLLLFTMTASSAMTIAREWKSEYQVYTKQEAELSEQIKANTEPDAVILANQYHWNLVTPLTGRSIVTGTGTFLYYHGIDNSERSADVAEMFEDPKHSDALFRKYGVEYVLISNAERGNYEIDYGYFEQNGTVVAQNDSGILYRLNY